MSTARERGLGATQDELVPAPALKRAPANVKAANAEAERLFDLASESVGEVKAARTEAANAEAADREALKAAVAAGKAEPKPTTTTTAEQVERVEARRAAILEARNEAVDALHDAIEQSLEQWSRDELALLDGLAEKAAAALTSADEVCRQIDDQATLVRTLHNYDSRSVDHRRTSFKRPGISAAPSLAELAATVRRAPATVTAGPTAREQREAKAAAKAETKARRRAHLDQQHRSQRVA